MEKIEKIFKSLSKIYLFGVLKVYPILLVIALILFAPTLYKSYFENKNYCLGSKDIYMFNFERKIKSRKISEVLVAKDVTSIAFGEGVHSSALQTCSRFSNDGRKFPIDSLSVGDLIKKEADSNIFTILKNGESYTFEIEIR